MRLYTHTHTHTYNLDNERGITLVALVITIVVLLILAGISISLVLGENGLISNAKEARDKTLETEKTEGESLNSTSDYIRQTVELSASEITAEDYGKVVTNYQEDSSNIWEIFYADSNNIYLITRNKTGNEGLTINGYNGTSDFDGSDEFKKKYPAIQAGWLNKVYAPRLNGYEINYISTDKINMKATEYLLDSSVWNEKYKTEKADWAIGASTLELFVASYNAINNEENKVTISDISEDENGYKLEEGLNKENSIPISDDKISGMEKSNIYNHGYSYWLACPCSSDSNNVKYVSDSLWIVRSSNYYAGGYAIRPVVCLNSSVTLVKNSDENTFSIK